MTGYYCARAFAHPTWQVRVHVCDNEHGLTDAVGAFHVCDNELGRPLRGPAASSPPLALSASPCRSVRPRTANGAAHLHQPLLLHAHRTVLSVHCSLVIAARSCRPGLVLCNAMSFPSIACDMSRLFLPPRSGYSIAPKVNTMDIVDVKLNTSKHAARPR